MSNDPRVEKATLDLIYLGMKVDALEKEVEIQAEEIRQLKKYLKINPNVLKNIVYNKNKHKEDI